MAVYRPACIYSLASRGWSADSGLISTVEMVIVS